MDNTRELEQIQLLKLKIKKVQINCLDNNILKRRIFYVSSKAGLSVIDKCTIKTENMMNTDKFYAIEIIFINIIYTDLCLKVTEIKKNKNHLILFFILDFIRILAFFYLKILIHNHYR